MILHRVGWLNRPNVFPQGYEVQCNTIWAMTDFTEENGATRVVPGSNKLGDKLKFKLEDSEGATMTKGSVLVYSGGVYHAGGANQSNSIRAGINITYNVSWLR